MTSVTIDLQALNTYLAPDLGLVTLNPGLNVGNTEPSQVPSVPSVMISPYLVPAANYRFQYNQVRYLKLGYLLERNGEYESGEFDLLSKAILSNSQDPQEYAPPALYLSQDVILQTSGSLGVTFSFISDSLSLTSLQPQFGLAFQITDASPAVFPTLRVFVLKNLPLMV